jgi:hypothetical protein
MTAHSESMHMSRIRSNQIALKYPLLKYVNRLLIVSVFFTGLFSASSSLLAATTVPLEVKMPGTQPEDSVTLDLNDGCDQCHEDDGDNVHIVRDWRGRMPESRPASCGR